MLGTSIHDDPDLKIETLLSGRTIRIAVAHSSTMPG